MSLKIDDFKGQLTQGGARPNLFRVYGGGLSAADSFLIKASVLPGSQVGQIDLNFRGRVLKVAGDRTFENWSLTVINDNNFRIRNYFEQWMNQINNHVGGTGAVQLNYMRNFTVEQLDRSGAAVKTYTISSAWPVSVSPIDVNFDTTNAVEEFTVDLAYQYWTANTTPGGSGLGISAGFSIGPISGRIGF